MLPRAVTAPPLSATRQPTDLVLAEAIRGLYRRRPDLSALAPIPRWLLPAMALFLCLMSFGAVLEPLGTWGGFGALLLAPLAGNTLLRFFAAFEVVFRPAMGRSGRHGRQQRPRTEDRQLPTYTVLVPMYDEPQMFAGLAASLASLDYPKDRLVIVFVLEANDVATRNAAARVPLMPHMRIIVVPSGGPQTKPKALNYTLAFTRSEMVVVFDAEDRPEPDQLRIAAAAFAEGGPRLACVQARLNVYNPDDSFWSRQFALEYSALFDGLLPALDRLRLPIPLGGTSNHFRTPILRGVGAWDPYNVTEDADLGIRLARFGYRTGTIASTTWEEAPTSRKVWVGQRTRWLKGWIQTWLVHMRRPGRLLRETGPWQFFGIVVAFGGVLLSVLAYPLAMVAMSVAWWLDGFDDVTFTGPGSWLWIVAFANLSTGILAPMLAASLAVVRRGRPRLLGSVIWMPAYWVLISLAGYRALLDLVRRPHYWEKTHHGLTDAGALPPPPPPRKPAATQRASHHRPPRR